MIPWIHKIVMARDELKDALWAVTEPPLVRAVKFLTRCLRLIQDKKWHIKFTDYCLESLPWGLLVVALYCVVVLLGVHHAR